jgi:hypothetical protein
MRGLLEHFGDQHGTAFVVLLSNRGGARSLKASLLGVFGAKTEG